MMTEMAQDEFWRKIESLLHNYDENYAPVRWFGEWGGLTKGRGRLLYSFQVYFPDRALFNRFLSD